MLDLKELIIEKFRDPVYGYDVDDLNAFLYKLHREILSDAIFIYIKDLNHERRQKLYDISIEDAIYLWEQLKKKREENNNT